MKNLIQTSVFLFITFFVFSCAKENSESANSAEKKILETRSSIGWCDGGESDPPAVGVLNSMGSNNFGECCVTFRFSSEFENYKVTLSTTDYHFGNASGNPGNNSIQHGNISNGLATFCFPIQGSHIAIQIYDNNGNLVACNTIGAPC